MENQYESVFIIRPDVKDEDIEKLIAKFSAVATGAGGTLEKVDKWGKKRFAFEVKNFKEGIYVLFLLRCAPAVVFELERTYRVNEDILRYLTTRVEGYKKITAKLKKKKKKKEVAPKPASVAPASAAPASPAATVAPTAPPAS